MNNFLKTILLIIFKNKERRTYSVPEGITPKEAYDNIVKSDLLNVEQIDKVLSLPNTYYDLEDVQYYFDEETGKVDEKRLAINTKVDDFRKKRSSFFKVLDTEFMRSLEDRDCRSCSNKIVKIKEHLRDLPSVIPTHLKDLELNDILQFNAFNNIYEMGIINGGSGYTETPTITIEPPHQIGIPMEAEAVIENGSVVDIKITQFGSGYIKPAGVTISKPPSGNVAIAVTSAPENQIN